MLDLLRAFFLINFQRNTTDAKNMGLFKMFIIDKIKLIYGQYYKYLLELGDEGFNSFRNFTATLLLKMKLRKFIIFEKNTISSYSLMPVSTLDTQFIDAVKIYY